jgi:hypothetical protein
VYPGTNALKSNQQQASARSIGLHLQRGEIGDPPQKEREGCNNANVNTSNLFPIEYKDILFAGNRFARCDNPVMDLKISSAADCKSPPSGGERILDPPRQYRAVKRP